MGCSLLNHTVTEIHLTKRVPCATQTLVYRTLTMYNVGLWRVFILG